MADELRPAADDDRPALPPQREKPPYDRAPVTGLAVPGDLVDEVGMGSFPASDPPAWWGGS